MEPVARRIPSEHGSGQRKINNVPPGPAVLLKMQQAEGSRCQQGAGNGPGVLTSNGCRNPRKPFTRHRLNSSPPTTPSCSAFWLENPLAPSGTHQLPGVLRRQVVLTNVEARAQQQGEIGAVVDNLIHAGSPAQPRNLGSLIVELTKIHDPSTNFGTYGIPTPFGA